MVNQVKRLGIHALVNKRYLLGFCAPVCLYAQHRQSSYINTAVSVLPVAPLVEGHQRAVVKLALAAKHLQNHHRWPTLGVLPEVPPPPSEDGG